MGRPLGSKNHITHRHDWVRPQERYVVRGACFLWSPKCYTTNEPASEDPRAPGQIRIGTRMVQAHRYVFELYALDKNDSRFDAWRAMLDERGELPPWVYVWQTCGDRRCIRPEHLRAGTHAAWRAAVSAREPRPRDAEVWTTADGLLTAEQVATIRDPERRESDSELARQYGVHVTTIRACRLGRTYKRARSPTSGKNEPTNGS